MNRKITFFLGLVATSVVVSCAPPPAPPEPTVNQQTTEDIKKDTENQTARTNADATDEGLSDAAREEQEAIRESAGISASDSSESTSSNSTGSSIVETLPDSPISTTDDPGSIIPQPTSKPVTFPYAVSVPNKPGFVFNPYTQSKVDVRGLPSGTLVTDPRDKTQKFYVP